MTNKEIKLIKEEILHYLCDDFKDNQAIFDRNKGFACFSETDLSMVMDKIVSGLKAAQISINKKS
jgi:hypothetical protein